MLWSEFCKGAFEIAKDLITKTSHGVGHLFASGHSSTRCLVSVILQGELVSTGEISGSHGGEYEGDCLLGCYAVLSGRSLPIIQRCFLPPSSGRSLFIAQHPTRQSSRSLVCSHKFYDNPD
jgi:hypothetical protein